MKERVQLLVVRGVMLLDAGRCHKSEFGGKPESIGLGRANEVKGSVSSWAWVLESGSDVCFSNPHTPDLGTLLFVFPTEGSGFLIGELVIKWFRIVVVYQDEGATWWQSVVGLEDQGMAACRGKCPHVQHTLLEQFVMRSSRDSG